VPLPGANRPKLVLGGIARLQRVDALGQALGARHIGHVGARVALDLLGPERDQATLGELPQLHAQRLALGSVTRVEERWPFPELEARASAPLEEFAACPATRPRAGAAAGPT
jgi:hypothetical protein